MSRSNRLGTRVGLSIAALCAACDVTSVAPERESVAGAGGDASAAARDGGGDATTDASADAAAADTGVPAWPTFPVPESVCALEVGAECDGREDCEGGQACCGSFDPLAFTYRQIRCADRCDGPNQTELCHPGETCRLPGHICRRSFILTYEFLSVCASPQNVPANATGEAMPGEIACGAESCQVGGEQCCLRTRFDFAARAIRTLEPYCAPLGHDCDCDHVLPPADAGVDGGGAEHDAGAD